MLCERCGHVNGPGARFCSSCGAELDADRTVHTPVPEIDTDESVEISVNEVAGEISEGEGALVVHRGPLAGARFLLDREVTTLGRHPDSTIFLDDVTVSRRHAEIRKVGERYEVHDVGSLNGTYVNRERVERAVLAHGDVVQVGRYRFIFLQRRRRQPEGEESEVGGALDG